MAIYADFIGHWVMDPGQNLYEQGEPPRSGSYTIRQDEDQLHFTMKWESHEGEALEMSFAGVPDGSLQPYNGGALADHLSLSAPSPFELNSSAYLNGVELMIAERQLAADQQSMVIKQTVILPDGNRLTNTSRYHRQHA